MRASARNRSFVRAARGVVRPVVAAFVAFLLATVGTSTAMASSGAAGSRDSSADAPRQDATVTATKADPVRNKAVKLRIKTPKAKRYSDREIKFKGRVKIKKSLRDQTHVQLQRKSGSKRKSGEKWKTRTQVGLKPNGRFVASDAPNKKKSRYRAFVRVQRNDGSLLDTAASKKTSLLNLSAADPERRFVIGMGDSYMSGEGATYAQYGPKDTWGQQSDWWQIAYGSSLKETYPQDYKYPLDMQPTGVRCHRSGSAGMMWGRDDYVGLNLACSGATYNSTADKPGLDLKANSQIQMLKQAAAKIKAQGDEVSSIQFSVGGNDVEFAEIMSGCITAFLTPFKTRCSNDADSTLRKQMAAGLEPAERAVREGLTNIVNAMDSEGFSRDSYRITVQTYPIGVPTKQDFQGDLGGNSGFGRQGNGGCGFTDGDLNYFNNELGPKLFEVMQAGADQARSGLPNSRVTVLNTTNAFSEHQLCSKDVQLWKGKGISDAQNTMNPPWIGFGGGSVGQWMSPVVLTCLMDVGVVNKFCGASDAVWLKYPAVFRAAGQNGWTNGCKSSTFWTAYPLLSDSQPPQCKETGENIYQLAMHPNYWGQRALAACNEEVATDERTVNKTVVCQNQRKLDQDPQGRPKMRITSQS